MTNLLMVISKDPYTTEIPDLALDIGISASDKGDGVSLYLVEDGTTAARKSEFGNKLIEAQKKGIKIFADDKAVLARALTDKLIEGIEIKEIGTLLDFIMEYDKVVWF